MIFMNIFEFLPMLTAFFFEHSFGGLERSARRMSSNFHWSYGIGQHCGLFRGAMGKLWKTDDVPKIWK